MSIPTRFLETPQAPAIDAVQDARRIRQRTLTLDDHASVFGCCDFFDGCTDEILSLYYKGTLDLLDWLGFNVTNECYRSVEFITYVRPEQYGGADTVGYIADPCADPNGIEFGAAKITVEDFGLIGREGPTRTLYTNRMRYCKTRPRYFLDGSPVNSEFVWDMTFTMDQVLNDARILAVTGNAATPGQFDGLQRWVRTGYSSSALDSYVVNWNGNPMSGGAGITINGNPAPAGFDLIDYLLDIHRNNKERMSWSPLLKNQTRRVGQKIIVLPGFLARCLLDFYTCWSVCPGAQYEEIVKDAKEMRDFRISLNGGLFGDGQISLDGDTIPLLIYDWGTIVGPTRGDIYMLTNAVGNQRVFEGEFLSAESALADLAADAGVGDLDDYFTRDGGRYMGKVDTENLCRAMKLWIALRLFCMAPWLQTRIQNVQCQTVLGPLSPNPADTSFFPVTSFVPAECP